MRAHLRQCKPCAQLARSQRASRGALKALLGGLPVPASFLGGGGSMTLGIAAKAAAVVCAGAAVGAGGYEAQKEIAAKPAVAAERPVAPHHSVTPNSAAAARIRVVAAAPVVARAPVRAVVHVQHPVTRHVVTHREHKLVTRHAARHEETAKHETPRLEHQRKPEAAVVHVHAHPTPHGRTPEQSTTTLAAQHGKDKATKDKATKDEHGHAGPKQAAVETPVATVEETVTTALADALGTLHGKSGK